MRRAHLSTARARRALIVGAGPGGIAAAGVFARSGYAVSWIDPSFDGGALSQYSSVPANTKVDLLQEQLQFFMPAVTRGCSPYRFGSSSAISVMCCIFTFTMALVRSFVTYSFCSSCDWYSCVRCRLGSQWFRDFAILSFTQVLALCRNENRFFCKVQSENGAHALTVSSRISLSDMLLSDVFQD